MPNIPRIYLITPSRLEMSFAHTLDLALSGGDVAYVQLRLKGEKDDKIIALAKVYLEICKSYDVPLLINDRVDLAKKIGSDGVHLGQSDGSVKQARQFLGKKSIIGVTCHDSRDLAVSAAKEGANYVAFGSIYNSQTKTPKIFCNIEVLEWWSSISEVPCVAIGGIDQFNCRPLVKANVDFIAVCASVWFHPEGPKLGISKLNATIVDSLD